MKIILTLIGTALTLGLSAQLKTVNTIKGDAPKAIHLDVPAQKKAVVDQRINGTWSPQQITYKKSSTVNLQATSIVDGRPLMIKGLLPADPNKGLSPAREAKNYLRTASELMGIENPDEEWSMISSDFDEIGMYHIKFQQVYMGIPVYGAEVIVHGNEEGMSALNGRYEYTPDIDNAIPSLESKAALDLVINDLGEIVKPTMDKYGIFTELKNSSDLVIYPSEDGHKLAYHMSVYENIVQRWEYILDAHSGNIISKHESICRFHNESHDHKCNHTAEAAPVPPVISNSQDLFGNTKAINTFQSGSNFFMIDAARSQMFDATNSSMPNEPVGTIWTIDAFDTSPQTNNFEYDHVKSSNINFPNERTAVSAHTNAGRAFDYFSNVHDRVSINGQGGNMISFVNVADEDSGGLDNAFWNGVAIFYGSGRNEFRELARGLDVAGHEMTHGVVQSTANLQYMGESGALNESFADVFGVMIDRQDWLIGEDVVNASSFPSGALRSMSDPHNGAAQGDFGNGFQPKKYSERFTGPQDNGGVHINSGIPNHAFYLFATSPNIGLVKAERIYYRALTRYLTKSSQFVDARIATVQAAMDLYGDTEVAALRKAWDDVEVFGENGTDYEVDVETNPGNDLVVFTSIESSGETDLFIANTDGSLIFNPATMMDPISQPSVTDDGSEILYVTEDQELGYLFINWDTQEIVQDITFNSDGGWRNAVFSKDGLRMAALRQVEEPEVFIFDFVSGNGQFFTLSNPTFSQEPTNTGDVVFADAMEFDFTGEFLMYDAFNRFESIFGNDIEYWDIGFIKVWNNSTNNFAQEGQIEKLFNGLPEGISIGNPTFAKNSPFIIAFDELENGDFTIKGANLETGEVGVIFAGNDRPGYPSFSSDDNALIFDAQNTQGREVIAARSLANSKIEGTGTAGVLLSYDIGVRWGVWFANGERVISNVEDELHSNQVSIYPNPATDIINIDIANELSGNYEIQVMDMMGKLLLQGDNLETLDLTNFAAGQYILKLQFDEVFYKTLITKQ